MGVLAAIFTLSLFQPGIQKLEDGFFNPFGRIGAREILFQLVPGQGDVVPLRLLLLHHNGKHGILVQFSGLTEFAKALRLG